jgi:hypothetical protein
MFSQSIRAALRDRATDDARLRLPSPAAAGEGLGVGASHPRDGCTALFRNLHQPPAAKR